MFKFSVILAAIAATGLAGCASPWRVNTTEIKDPIAFMKKLETIGGIRFPIEGLSSSSENSSIRLHSFALLSSSVTEYSPTVEDQQTFRQDIASLCAANQGSLSITKAMAPHLNNMPTRPANTYSCASQAGFAIFRAYASSVEVGGCRATGLLATNLPARQAFTEVELIAPARRMTMAELLAAVESQTISKTIANQTLCSGVVVPRTVLAIGTEHELASREQGRVGALKEAADLAAANEKKRLAAAEQKRAKDALALQEVQARAARELPLKRKVGARVCKYGYVGDGWANPVLDSIGFVENFSAEKLQIRVTSPREYITWDVPFNWVLCEL